MQVSIKDISGDRVLAEVSGSACPSAIKAGPDPITKALGAHAWQHNVLLHLGSLEMVDSSAVGWLLKCHKAFREAGGRLVVHSLQPAAANVLKVLSVDKVLTIARAEADALQLLKTNQ